MTNKNEQSLRDLRDFPAVEILAGDAALATYVETLTRPLVIKVVQAVIAAHKERFQAGDTMMTTGDLVKAAVRELQRLSGMKLSPLINATGIIIHTNLGRAPLSEAMMWQAVAIATGYSNLEYEIAGGRRGSRGIFVEHLLAVLADTEAGTIVNNNAAALFIMLNTLAPRQGVIISRGELVQIGGGFRIPDIMIKSGVRLVEVGTTNRTTIEDYRQAVTERTRMILKVHRSNFTQVGFVQEAPLGQLADLCRERKILLAHDLGSGLFAFPPGLTMSGEPTVAESVRAGADLTCFSGDKLLGGAQAGLIVGRGDLIARIKKNPLFRTIRCDKLVFAITSQVLQSYLKGTPFVDVPVWRMITIPVGDLKRRGEAIVAACPGRDMVLVATEAYLGGGTTPSQTIPSLALSLRSGGNATALSRKFRLWSRPIIGRVESDDFLLDLRTVAPDDDTVVIAAINQILR